ncbi:LCP family protein [Phytoactinopolyspora limicola]|uniref:LCP family protein n=1 Tax=Phytoactinopolyspora limicola TaxID=2715536 RepID=UPI00140C355F|nr:LCP family protein [Phytoactinopolyspora limicola]
MSRAGGPRGSRRARLESRRHERTQRYGRFIRWTAVGSLIPGVGLIAAGKRRIGTFLLVMFILAMFGVGAVVALTPSGRLLSYSGDRQMLLVIGVALVTAAIIWLIVALATHRALEPIGLPAGKRLGGALVVVVIASLVVAPMSLGARNVFTQRDVIGAISGGHSNTTPDIKDSSDPWADIPQLNLLLLGSDAGDGRDGIRPDTLIVASIDTHSGDTTMISVPRNLRSFPFPDDSPLAERYPNGFRGEGDAGEWMINATYRNIPALQPDVFEGVENPGADATKWAVEGALGIDIDYFVMVNLDGFMALVDALGGVTLDVPRDIPIGNKEIPGTGGCTQARGYIHAGDAQRLNGSQALWFARSRCGSDDYDRMARQQCVLGAIVDEIDPRTVLVKYQELASATVDIIQTDVPEELFPALIELAIQVQRGTLESLTLDRDFFNSMGATSADPNYDILHTRIGEILAPSEPDDESGPADDSGSADDPPADSEPGENPDDPTDDTADEPAGDTYEAAPGTSGNGVTDDDPGADTPSDDADNDEVAPDQPVETDDVC